MAIELPTYLRAKFPELATHWTGVQSKFKTESIPAQTTLLTVGDVATHLYLIVQGSLHCGGPPPAAGTSRFSFSSRINPLHRLKASTYNGATKVPRPAATKPWSLTILRCSTGCHSTKLRPTWG